MGRPTYRILVELSYPTDPAVLARLRAHEGVPWEERGMVVHLPGELVADVPEESVPWLLEQGVLERVTDVDTEPELVAGAPVVGVPWLGHSGGSEEPAGGIS